MQIFQKSPKLCLTNRKIKGIMEASAELLPNNRILKDLKERNAMKSTGMVRKVDELGRIVLPAEIRQNMDIETRDSLEIYTDGDRIILQKYHPACIFCTNADNLVYFNQKRICPECLAKIKALD